MKKTLSTRITIITVSLLPLMVYANPSASVASPSVLMGKVVFALMMTIILILGLAWIVKKYSLGGIVQQKGIKILSTMSLGSQEKLLLIEVENKKLLLGVTKGGISTLKEFDVEALHSDLTPVNTERNNEVLNNSSNNKFSDYLSKVLKSGVDSE